MSLAEIKNVRENESCLWKSKCKRASYWKSRVYIVNPCHSGRLQTQFTLRGTNSKVRRSWEHKSRDFPNQ